MVQLPLKFLQAFTRFKACLRRGHFFEVHSVWHLHPTKFSSASAAISFVKTDSEVPMRQTPTHSSGSKTFLSRVSQIIICKWTRSVVIRCSFCSWQPIWINFIFCRHFFISDMAVYERETLIWVIRSYLQQILKYLNKLV